MVRAKRNVSQKAFCNANFVGGVGQSVIPFGYLNSENFDSAVRCDVALENQRTKELADRMRKIATINLAESQTSLTLLQSKLPTNNPIYLQTGIASGEEGLAQARAIGAIATEQAIETDQHRRIWNGIQNEIIIAANGIPPVATSMYFFGIGGGTSSGAVHKLLRHEAETLLAMGTTVHQRLYAVDSMAFANLGDNVHKNAAAFIEEHLDHLDELKKRFPPEKLIADITVLAIRPTQADQETRDRLIQTSIEALNCPDYQAQQRRTNANRVIDGPYGNITFATIDQYESIPRSVVVEVSAQVYHAAVRAKFEQLVIPPARVRGIDDKSDSVPLNRPAIKDLIEVCKKHSNQEIQAAIEAPQTEQMPRLFLETLEGELIELSKLAEQFVTVPETLSKAIDRIELLAAALSAIKKEQILVSSDIERLEKDRKRRRRSVERRLDWMRQGRWGLHRLLTVFTSTKKLFAELREVSDQYRWQKSVEAQLEKHEKQCNSELAGLRGRLSSLLNCLDDHRKQSEAEELKPLFTVRPLESVFRQLLEMTDLSRPNQELVLGSFVEQVTLEGLRVLSGSNSQQIEKIVDRFANDAPYQGPGVGGVRPAGAQASWIFPPLDHRVEQALVQEFAKRHPPATIFINDKATMGLEVTKILEYRPLTRENCFPGLLRGALKQSYEPPRSVLFHSAESIERNEAANRTSNAGTTNAVTTNAGPTNAVTTDAVTTDAVTTNEVTTKEESETPSQLNLSADDAQQSGPIAS